MFSVYKHKYSLVNDDEEKTQAKKKGSLYFCKWPYGSAVGLSVIFIFILGGILGFGLGRRDSFEGEVSSTLKLEKVVHSFRYNISFTEEPSPYTDQLWQDLLPINGGFFVHETIAPTRTTFSSFHQLHCLNGIREAYWKSYKAAVHGEKLNETELPMDIQPHHVQHCIDLLRQTLMCHADTTLEVADDKIGGVDGFRAEHQCSNWEQLVQWTSAQQIKWKGQNTTATMISNQDS